MHLVYRQTCRSCGSAALTKVNDLGEQYLQGSFLKPGDESPPLRKIPLTLVRCDPTRDESACGLLQLAHTTPPDILYASYWYRSGTNETMRNHLRQIAEEALAMLHKPRARLLDIGCNDGTLLKSFPRECAKFGIDPSNIAGDLASSEEAEQHKLTVVQSLFPSPKLKVATNGEKFDLITAIAMLYDLENPREFVRSIRQHLAPGGLWLFEMSYMPQMLKMNSYDTICHEHLEYYSLAVLEFMLKRERLKVVRATLNPINGGSLRCYATHDDEFGYDDPDYHQTLKVLRQQEFDMRLDTDNPYRNFQDRIDKHRAELQALLKKIKREGKTIHVYGASTKGNTILQWCGIDNTIIEYAADRNPEKHGAKTLGTDIPIISEEESRAMKPDYYLALPWHFRQEFLEREKQTLARGTAFIFPLPEIEITSHS